MFALPLKTEQTPSTDEGHEFHEVLSKGTLSSELFERLNFRVNFQ